MSTDQHPVLRDSGISYLHIPARDPSHSVRFYQAVFGWSLTGGADLPGFEDGTGHVIGKFVTSQAATGEDGIRPFVDVESLDRTLARIAAHGGDVVTAPYPEEDVWVATFRDLAGNVLGVRQRGPREQHRVAVDRDLEGAAGRTR